MGVVHKLNDDVRDFIVEQKNKNPAIGCRKLCDNVHEKFGIFVSKSSVSTILKSANLNSPIGRPSFSERKSTAKVPQPNKKFKLPEQKKKQIFITSIPDTQNPAPTARDTAKPKIKLPDNNKIINQGSANPETGLFNKEMSNLEEIKAEKDSLRLSQSGVTPIKNAGIIFLKAAEWDMACGPILRNLLKDELGARPDIVSEIANDLLLWPEIFETPVKSFPDFTTGGWLWPKEAVRDYAVYSAAFDALRKITDIGIKLAIETEILSQKTSYVSITPKGNTGIYVNIKNRNLIDLNVQSEESYFVQSEKYIYENLIRNVQSAIFFNSNGVKDTDQLVDLFNRIFSDNPKESMTEITVFDSQHKEIYRVDSIPAKKRIYAVALENRDRDFLKCEGELKSGYPGESVTIFEQVFHYRACPFREQNTIISLSRTPTAPPFVLLISNCGEKSETIKKVVTDFLRDWLGVSGVLAEKNYTQVDYFHIDIEKELNSGLNLLVGKIKNRAKNLFGEKLISEQNWLLGLKGNILEEHLARVISFDISENHHLIPALKQAVQIFNCRSIKDVQNRRIFLKTGQ